MNWKEHLKGLHTTGLVKAPQLVLLATYNADGGGMAVAEVTRLTGLSGAHTSTAVESLELRRFIERRFPARDGRTVTLYLTATGRAQAEAMLTAIRQVAQPT